MQRPWVPISFSLMLLPVACAVPADDVATGVEVEHGAAEDDYEESESEQALAASGSWNLPTDVRVAGDGQYVHYDDAPAWQGGAGCGGGLRPGARALGDFILQNFNGASTYQGYSCRQNTANLSKTSVHGTGRALDVFVPLSGGQADNGLGDPIANWLVSHASEIGIQYIVWDRARWSASRPAGTKHGAYGGPHPHHDHLHIELTIDAGEKRTPFFQSPPSVVAPEATGGRFVAVVRSGAGDGYWAASRDGGVFTFGSAAFHGSAGAMALNRPVVGMAAMADGSGYWLVADDGGVFAFGAAPFHGSAGDIALNRPVVGMAALPDGSGYWLVASDGGVFSYGDARFHGSTGAMQLNAPIVGMAATPSGNGYWLVASDGGIFAFGDAGFHGSAGATPLNRPVVGMAATPSGDGYWLVASDGGIFSYGDAAFHGSAGSLALSEPVAGMAALADGTGYWMVGGDGGIFSFGAARFHGRPE